MSAARFAGFCDTEIVGLTKIQCATLPSSNWAFTTFRSK
jgi:hypothetical protein